MAGALGMGIGGAVVTPTAEVLEPGDSSVAVHSEYRAFENLSRTALADRAVESGHVHALDYLWSPTLSLAYGLTESITIAATLSYVERADLREGHVHGDGSGGAHDLGDANGLGDASVGTYWQFWDSGIGSSATISVGSFVPTGSTHEKNDEGERFETDHQPGSGAWGPFVGLTFSTETARVGLHANARYKWATQGAQQTDLGDRFEYGAAVVYRLSGAREHDHHGHDAPAPHSHDHGRSRTELAWDLLLEMNGEYQQAQEVDGEKEGDSETILFLSPGLRVTGNGWTSALSVGAPLHQDVDDAHIEVDWRVLATLAFSI